MIINGNLIIINGFIEWGLCGCDVNWDCPRLTNQVDSDAGSYQVAHVDVYGVTAVLCDLRQAGEARRHAESEDQQRLQQLRGAVDAGVKVHLEGCAKECRKDSSETQKMVWRADNNDCINRMLS